MDYCTVGLLQACHVGYNAWLDEAREASRPVRLHGNKMPFGAPPTKALKHTPTAHPVNGSLELPEGPKVRRSRCTRRTTCLFTLGAVSLWLFIMELFSGNPT